jgi:hypothetical protein
MASFQTQAQANYPTPKQGADTSRPEAEQELVNRVAGHIRRMRFFRRAYDARRLVYYRQYVGNRAQRNYPDNVTPRSNIFVPYPYSNVEQVVARIMDAFFSFQPWFECTARAQKDEMGADAMQEVLDYKLGKSNFITEFEHLVRNLCIYGHAGIKVDWDWDTDILVDPQPQLLMQMVEVPQPDPENPQGPPKMVKTPQPVLDPQTMVPVVQAIRPVPRAIPRMRPKFAAVDVFDLMVDPDGKMVAHLVEKTLPDLRAEAAAKPEYYNQKGLQELEKRLADVDDRDSVIIRLAELWNDIDKSVTLMVYGEDQEAISWKDTRAAFRGANLSSYKRKVYAGAPILLYNGPNQFDHKRIAILHTSYVKLPGEPFGLGLIETISDISEALNVQVNMIVDNWNLGVNRRYAYNTEVDIDHAALNSFNVPGGKVGVSGNPAEVIMPLPTHTPEAGDYEILGLFKQMIEMTSGISDFYAKGVGSPTGNRTASGINQIMNETNIRFKQFIRNLELDILQPLLSMCASMIQQFMTNEEEIRITNDRPGIPKYPLVQPEQLIGNYEFKLVAANYATNKVLRQRNLLAWANWASQSPYFDQYKGLIEMGKVFEIHGIMNMLKSPEQVQMEQQQAQEQQVQMMILEAMLKTGQSEHIEGVKAQYKMQQQRTMGKGATPGKGGKPRKVQLEGKIPGTGVTGLIRSFAQQHLGGQAHGLEGLEGG